MPDEPTAQSSLPGLARDAVRESGEEARRTRAATVAARAEPAAVDPVARVLVDLPLAHLDRSFDYTVPATMDAAARPGVRVRIRFAGQEVGGFLLERAAGTEHPGRLAPLRRVVSGEAVLTPAVAELTRLVAERYAGTRSDVLRLAVPPRHARTEKEASPAGPDGAGAPEPAGWAAYPTGAAWLRHLGGGEAPRAVWGAAPGEDWPRRLAEAAAATLSSGRGAIICVPDVRDVDRVDAALAALLGEGRHVALTADVGPARRYRDFLALLRGARRVVVGTRSAAFAPVADLGLVAVWDDGDDLHAEPRAPYPHTRETLLLRAGAEGTAALVGAFGRTVEAQQLLETGWAREVAPEREEVRRRLLVGVAGGGSSDRDPHARAARVPGEAHQMLRAALAGPNAGPVLVQAPRAGYAASLACERCRSPARCAACGGPVRQTGAAEPPECRWCGTAFPDWRCATCGHRGLRAPVVGESRTAEELGRAFAPVPVLRSGGDHVLPTVADRPALVVATPGAEPVAEAGYAGVLLLDTWLALSRPDLRTGEETLRRWLNAAALARSGGRVLAVGDPAEPALQALVRWDPAGFARREATERRAAHLPPASRLATVTGEPGAVVEALALLAPPAGTELLGPAPVEGGPVQGGGEVRTVVRSPRSAGADLSRALGEMQRLRSARKLAAVRVQVDPPVL